MLTFYNSMSAVELVSFVLIFNFFQFVIVNMFSELFWSSHKFNRSHQNFFVSNLIFLFVELLAKVNTTDSLKVSLFNFYIFKNK